MALSNPDRVTPPRLLPFFFFFGPRSESPSSSLAIPSISSSSSLLSEAVESGIPTSMSSMTTTEPGGLNGISLGLREL